MIFEELYNSINSVVEELDNMVVEAMVEHKEEIIDLNTSQLDQGLNSKGEEISPSYASDDYAELKKSMGSKAPLGTPNIEFEGDFKSSIYGEAYNTSNEGMSGLFVNSSDSKTSKLENKYSGIFGIMPANSNELVDITIETITNKAINGIIK